MRRFVRGWSGLLAALAVAGAALAAAPRDQLLLRGVLTRADHQTYREVPFAVPVGVDRLTVDFAYTGWDQHTVVDLGIFDPNGFRGWSGGNKTGFTLSPWDATPSYLAGPIVPGRWRLVLGVPNIRPGAKAAFEARVTLERHGAPSRPEAPMRPEPGWYRGDLHLHTAHSDGSCGAQSGAVVPCPVFKTVEAAAARWLDFIVVSDHNTVSQGQDLRELQPYFDRLLLIRGEEITTFRGHLGVIGADGWVDFRLGSRSVPTPRALLDGVTRAGGLVVINHPGLPSGEACMGCGWSAPDTPFDQVAAVEVVNGGVSDGPLSGLPFWEARLNAGDHLTAVGGSDNHRPDSAPDAFAAVGRPTTVVWAGNLGQQAILAGIAAGHVFIDVDGTRTRRMEMSAGAARMGDTLPAGRGDVRLALHAVGARGGRWRVIEDGRTLPDLAEAPIAADDETCTVSLARDGRRHWVRAEVRSPDGRRAWLIGNPIYLAAAAP